MSARQDLDQVVSTIPADWGLPGWTAEQFKAFNDARRKVHKLMQRWDQFLTGKSAVSGKE